MKSMPLLSNLPNRRADTCQLAALLRSLPWQTHSFWPRPRLCKLHRLLLRLQAAQRRLRLQQSRYQPVARLRISPPRRPPRQCQQMEMVRVQCSGAGQHSCVFAV